MVWNDPINFLAVITKSSEMYLCGKWELNGLNQHCKSGRALYILLPEGMAELCVCACVWHSHGWPACGVWEAHSCCDGQLDSGCSQDSWLGGGTALRACNSAHLQLAPPRPAPSTRWVMCLFIIRPNPFLLHMSHRVACQSCSCLHTALGVPYLFETFCSNGSKYSSPLSPNWQKTFRSFNR